MRQPGFSYFLSAGSLPRKESAFEPATFGLKVRRSSQAELRARANLLICGAYKPLVYTAREAIYMRYS